MISLTAVIRSKPGMSALIRDSLKEVAAFASASEPGTVSYFVAETPEGVFITHERYVDQTALDAHNGGPGAKGFFARAETALDKVEVYIGPELFPG
jgi:quinol monooxygenase YgiN